MTKVLISIDDELLKQIDRAARAKRLTRSAYLAGLAKRDATATSARLVAARRAALKRLDRLFASAPPGDSTELIRAERDAR